MLLQQQEQLENGRRLPLEDIVFDDLQEAVLDLKALVERLRLHIRIHQDRFLEQLQQHLVQAAQVHDRAVIALHQLLDREHVGRVLVAEQLRNPGLVVEQQPVLLAPGQHVQGEANPPEKFATLAQHAQLARRQEPVSHQGLEVAGAEMPVSDPQDHVDVAQPAGAALDVGLQVVGRVVVAARAAPAAP